MIKQSKISKICWAFVYLLPLFIYLLNIAFSTNTELGIFPSLADAFEGLPYMNINFFSSSALSEFVNYDGQLLDYYLGYLVLVSLFRIVWRVLVYLPDVVGKLIDRWSL